VRKFSKPIFIAFLSCFAVSGFSQTFEENKDFTDVVKQWKHDTTPSGPPEIQVGKNYISLLPFIGYAPANGFMIGAAVSISRKVAPPPTKLSSGMLNLQLTSKEQFIINARSKVYLKNNKWFLQGDWRLMFFSQPTYGLGINNSGGNQWLLAINELPENAAPLAEPMRFNYLRFYEDVVRQVGDKNLYVGLGIAIDQHYSIRDEKLNTDTTSEDFYITNHYAYSVTKEFNPKTYITNGLNLNILTDTRDVIANPYSGYFASLSLRFNPKIFRSSQYSLMASYDFRYYLGLSKEKKRHLLAFWTWGTFVLDGEVPYLALPSIGWDTYNRSGRGYIQGRYRGLNMIYAEAEYRFPLSNNGLFGGVAFLSTTFASSLNASTAHSSDQRLFEKAAPAMGVGFRMKMDKAARVNLTVDYGVGLDHSHGIYFSMQEAF
jgi:hypothetical protein